MLTSLVRKTLEIYLGESRLITQSEFPEETLTESQKKESVFVTLYHEGRVIASSGRIQCKKENTLFECIDNTLLCLKDERFAPSLQSPDMLGKIQIRVDRFVSENRRMLTSIDSLDIRTEGILFLSQNLGVLSIILPNMVHVGSTPQAYFELACTKAGVDPKKLDSRDYNIYGLTTVSETDFE
ncbi:AMMECR1 domain-containing protein [Candidatus Gracilibacteria bacterium]|nr:AMMECR1 domain-containing protein [Candidatus Gracilibacteria bacterium]